MEPIVEIPVDFKKSPTLPEPVSDHDAATKKYVDDNAGGVGNNIYTADDSLISDRIVDLNSHSLSFNDMAGMGIGMSPATDLIGLGTEGGCEIQMHANAATYTADTHTFNGKIINPDIVAKNFADDAAAATGGVEIGEDYHTDGVKKVRIS